MHQSSNDFPIGKTGEIDASDKTDEVDEGGEMEGMDEVYYLRARPSEDLVRLAKELVGKAPNLLALGVAAYIRCLPAGAPADLDALDARFEESRAELEVALRDARSAGLLDR
ncbi:hypothetical protein GCM10027160_33010 [Streptomyces calidiresistens]|uniref:Uncharacterized protein n=1 Tax=Streptomyces calidiresistens TaxID=1485586 RepID=A0A7W3XXQ3_9ACTN|nr:hypothetical protein [Streptomyces calidiresistens]MBB0231158.1 hypothetical protein [Streptomyces calidiresistens]